MSPFKAHSQKPVIPSVSSVVVTTRNRVILISYFLNVGIIVHKASGRGIQVRIKFIFHVCPLSFLSCLFNTGILQLCSERLFWVLWDVNIVPEILHIIGKAEVIQNRERNEKGMRRDREKNLFLLSVSALLAA